MTIESQKLLCDIALWIVVICVPLLIVAPPKKRQPGVIPLSRFFLSIALGYSLILFLQFGIFQWINISNAVARGDTNYDPVGTNAAILVTGWIPLLLSTLLVSVSALAYDKLKAKKRNHDDR